MVVKVDNRNYNYKALASNANNLLKTFSILFN